ncbi:hypothetical protein J2T56_002297 [Natronobacillus azotifigens]|uniref:Endolytic transglycosylase MltG n=1 Tax=Natronobacillus azotifigens TaxID=472978 RepID=A0A9J6RES7_9BACI|nr:hypothetical protein [Natronobacillus azotifigens]MCZ0704055.1 hypothetical protein [Natronobacillus azotifigens]
MKQVLRAFALGLITATLLLGVIYLLEDEVEPEIIETTLSNEEMIQQLEQEGYSISEESMYDDSIYEDSATDADIDQDNISDENHENEDTSTDEDESTYTTDDHEQDNNNVYILTIEPGMTVSQVAEYLVAAGIIENRTEFIDYLAVNNYGTNIQVGQFELIRTMSLAEVAELIANRN